MRSLTGIVSVVALVMILVLATGGSALAHACPCLKGITWCLLQDNPDKI